MGRVIKIGIWVGVGALVAGIIAKAVGIPLPIGPQTVQEYMQDVVDNGTLERTSKKIATQYAKKQGQGFDSARFERDLDSCLHDRIGTWLHGDDPQLGDPISREDVRTIAGKFISACVADLSQELSN